MSADSWISDTVSFPLKGYMVLHGAGPTTPQADLLSLGWNLVPFLPPPVHWDPEPPCPAPMNLLLLLPPTSPNPTCCHLPSAILTILVRIAPEQTVLLALSSSLGWAVGSGSRSGLYLPALGVTLGSQKGFIQTLLGNWSLYFVLEFWATPGCAQRFLLVRLRGETPVC